ncbi:glycosyl transferase [Xaviernesmea oryzae]|uniref:Glycosyl transferase n=1 Tax=Xaviernesmea oryzae TaxID=464029 RepID=A0A1Q9B315_9HYPH|nr:glycosyltransferase [Xaviernesmea oryzae]OLP62383.1 glycosyl transferase [Xaviernesmea oryzae]SEL98889.1 Predicted glycosyl transferase [Xaviernesmea oryzae]
MTAADVHATEAQRATPRSFQSGPARVLFYVQHLLGIGHIARASRLADALSKAGFAVTVVTGGAPVDGFPGPGVDHIALPPVKASDVGFKGLFKMDGTPADDRFKADRRDLLLGIFDRLQPDVLITEAFPFGRRQMLFELLPLMEAALARKPKPLVVASLRDILQERPKPARDRETVDFTERFYDEILVHGDPSFARLEETFPFAAEVADKVRYTGLVAPPKPTPSEERYEVVVSAGGGAVGRDVIEAALKASHITPRKGPWAIITGPNLPQADFDRVSAQAPADVNVFRFRRDFGSLLASAALSVSQAGYNTAGDILRAGCRAVLIPFTTGGETEQGERAARLERLGLARVLKQENLSPQVLSVMIQDALTMAPHAAPELDLDGARNTATLLSERLAQRAGH